MKYKETDLIKYQDFIDAGMSHKETADFLQSFEFCREKEVSEFSLVREHFHLCLGFLQVRLLKDDSVGELMKVIEPSSIEWDEEAIAQEAACCVNYALYVLEGPFKKGEKTIARDRSWALAYVLMVLRGPLEAAEPVIAEGSEESYFYAVITGKPFPLGEPAIYRDKWLTPLYKRSFPRLEAGVEEEKNEDSHS